MKLCRRQKHTDIIIVIIIIIIIIIITLIQYEQLLTNALDELSQLPGI